MVLLSRHAARPGRARVNHCRRRYVVRRVLPGADGDDTAKRPRARLLGHRAVPTFCISRDSMVDWEQAALRRRVGLGVLVKLPVCRLEVSPLRCGRNRSSPVGRSGPPIVRHAHRLCFG